MAVQFEGALGSPTSAPEVFALHVQRDREQPRPEQCTSPKIVPAPMELQKRLLDQVSRILGPMEPMSHHPLQHRAIPTEQLAERRAVASEVVGHELLVRLHRATHDNVFPRRGIPAVHVGGAHGVVRRRRCARGRRAVVRCGWVKNTSLTAPSRVGEAPGRIASAAKGVSNWKRIQQAEAHAIFPLLTESLGVFAA